jgi:hypothetical protein
MGGSLVATAQGLAKINCGAVEITGEDIRREEPGRASNAKAEHTESSASVATSCES